MKRREFVRTATIGAGALAVVGVAAPLSVDEQLSRLIAAGSAEDIARQYLPLWYRSHDPEARIVELEERANRTPAVEPLYECATSVTAMAGYCGHYAGTHPRRSECCRPEREAELRRQAIREMRDALGI